MIDIIKYLVKLNKEMEGEYTLFSKKEKDKVNNWIMYGICSLALIILLMTTLSIYENILFFSFFVAWMMFLRFRMEEE